MAYEIKKTEHNGAKRGKGAWCRKVVAKAQSSRIRRFQSRQFEKIARAWAE